jgi:hypothetical protein
MRYLNIPYGPILEDENGRYITISDTGKKVKLYSTTALIVYLIKWTNRRD